MKTTPIKTVEEVLEEDVAYYLDEFEKQQNTFYPNSMAWSRFKLKELLKFYHSQLSVTPLSEDQIRDARQKNGFGIQPRDVETCIWMQSHFFQQPVIDKLATTEPQEGKEEPKPKEMTDEMIQGVWEKNSHHWAIQQDASTHIAIMLEKDFKEAMRDLSTK